MFEPGLSCCSAVGVFALSSNGYLRRLNSTNHEIGDLVNKWESEVLDEDLAIIINERSAYVSGNNPDYDGGPIYLRLTPKGQPTVADLIKPGYRIKDYADDDPTFVIYSTVLEVSEYSLYGLPVWHLTVMSDDDMRKFNDSGILRGDVGGINELVAQDGQIFHLFANNGDRVEVVERAVMFRNPLDEARKAREKREKIKARKPKEPEPPKHVCKYCGFSTDNRLADNGHSGRCCSGRFGKTTITRGMKKQIKAGISKFCEECEEFRAVNLPCWKCGHD